MLHRCATWWACSQGCLLLSVHQVNVLQGLPDRDPVRFDWVLQWTLRSSLWAIPCLMLSSTGVAPLSPGFPKLLSDTVRTFAVSPSWMYLMGSDVNCMLSEPSCTCDPRICCWPSGDICQAMLLLPSRCSSTHCGLPPHTDDLLSVRFRCLAIVLPAPRFPSFRPDTVSFRSCLSLPPGFLSTREAGICAGSRACFPLLFLLDFSVPLDVCKVIQAATEQILFKRR